jgi:hypothetical protein
VTFPELLIWDTSDGEGEPDVAEVTVDDDSLLLVPGCESLRIGVEVAVELLAALLLADVVP